MTGRGMHRASALFEGDMLAENNRYLAFIERMGQLQPAKGRAAATLEHFIVRDPIGGHALVSQQVSDDQPFRTVAVRATHQRILNVGM